ncbi:immunoglobulin-like domain-containing protein [Sutcliffiella rhizosphaerae]|uniref:C-type lectin domain-containing protein n=1 Tax=Sutcliffiella rhizosphaerae TaxID=2880967 RepID=A0ABM8YMF2_9BACI|nr:immunoglobulin-like domain-containing protein [Sutcliffiella rhizosphaerae]CAG9621132.1 hypothetical protein BACCIP111883_01904 [Sutcliffiella rhizosphaerae]
MIKNTRFKRTTSMTMIMLLLFYYVIPFFALDADVRAFSEKGIWTSEHSTSYFKDSSPMEVDSDLQLNLTNDSTLTSIKLVIQNVKAGDELHFTEKHGISGGYDSASGALTLSGEASSEQFEEVLRGVTFSTTSADLETRDITFTIGGASYLEQTNHYYEYVSTSSPVSWEDAKKAAENRSFLGKQGYLATVTSQEEHDFLAELSLGASWLGARDINRDLSDGGFLTGDLSQGDWRWVTGPEAEQNHGNGLKFYSGYIGFEGTEVSCETSLECNKYTNWAADEPNNQAASKWVLQLSDAKWSNQSPASGLVSGYLVEYGGLPTDNSGSIFTKAKKLVEVHETSSTTEITSEESEEKTEDATEESTEEDSLESKEAKVDKKPEANMLLTSLGCTFNGARAVFGGEAGTELFLGGSFIELGISNWGDFGTLGSKPANFRGTLGGEIMPHQGSDRIGMSADHDGFCNGRDLPVDYYLPGTPEERFVVGYKAGSVTESNTNSAQMGDKNMSTTVANESNTSSGLLKARTVSVWDSKMEITQVISFNVNDKFYRNDVTIKNISSSEWDGARYMRSFDPDNSQFRGGSFDTANTVTHTIAEDRKAVVKAETYSNSDPLYVAFGSRIPIFYYSNDTAAKASIFGFSNRNPYKASAYDNPRLKGQTVYDDIAITMTWDSGKLAAGDSKTFTYYTSLDERDFADVSKEIFIDDVKKDIDEIDDFDDVKKVKDKIDAEESLDEETKKELKTDIIDVLTDEKKDFPVRGKDDILLIGELIKESDLSEDEKDDVRKDIVKKIIEDIEELTAEEEEATKELIEEIVDPEKKEEAERYFTAKTDVKTPAEKAIEEAEEELERYEKVEGDVTEDLYKEVEEAKKNLKEALETVPLDKKKVVKETKALEEATKALEEATNELELEKAKKVAEKAIDKATEAKDRYELAEGDETDDIYTAVETAKKELQEALDKDPANKEEIEEATEKLKEITSDLEKASEAKELENAKKDAEKAIETATNTEDRYKLAEGDESKDVYTAAETAKKELKEALDKDPANKEEIEAATEKIKETTADLEKASEAKELENAKKDAEKAIETATKIEDRYKLAEGDEAEEVYTAVEAAKKELKEALDKDPSNKEVIEAATEKLAKATSELEKASEAKELENAKKAAKKAIESATKAKDRYELAEGNETEDVYTAVEAAKKELQEALDKDSANKEEIEAATKKLEKAIAELEKASEAKELDNAKKAGEEVLEAATKEQERYKNAAGDETDDFYIQVETAKKKLKEALNADQADKDLILSTTTALNEIINQLDKINEEKELENAKKAAEKAIDEATNAEYRYELADGEETEEVYTAVDTAKKELQEALSKDPANKEELEKATEKLAKATSELEKASEAKELENAKKNAEKAMETANNAKDRYKLADGDESKEAYKAVEKAKKELQKELDAKPADTKKIIIATELLIKTTKELDKVAADKELENEVSASKDALERAEKEQNRYEATGGKNTDKVNQAVEAAKESLQKALQAKPQQKEQIQQARKELEAATKELQNERIKKEIEKKIAEAKTVDRLVQLIKDIETSVISEKTKAELYTKVVDTLLNEKNNLSFTDSKQIVKVVDTIEKTTKSNNEKQQAIVKITEKAIWEVAKKDQPLKDKERFQQPVNKAILDAAQQVKNDKERERLIRLLEITVDARSLSTETAFVFAKGDTWESITSQFIMLTKGHYGSAIAWESNKTDVIKIAQNQATVDRKVKDQSVILTATISNGNQTIEKTFLLVVKSNAFGKKEIENVKREVTVAAGSNLATPPAIQRINLWDMNGNKIVNKIDKLIIDHSVITEAVTESLVIYMPDDKKNLADEIAVEIPLSVLELIQATLTIKTDQGSIILSRETIEQMQLDGKDLFFRIVPIRETTEKNNVIDRLQKHELVMAELNVGQQAKVLGTPREIETNYKGYETTVILPLDDVEFTNIENLRIFIEHTDGDRKVLAGEIVVDENGHPVGLQFTINKFSTFTIFEIVASETSEGNNPPSGGENKPPHQGEKPKGENTKPVVEGKKPEDIKKLPNTATATYTFMLIGFLLVLLGVIMLIVRKSIFTKLVK